MASCGCILADRKYPDFLTSYSMNAYPKVRSNIVKNFNRAAENIINSYHKTHLIIKSKLPRRTVEQQYNPGGDDIRTKPTPEQESNYKSILQKCIEIQIEQE